ncbi:MAG: hypothetical protein ACI379_08320 [Nocardioides sp.]|uniref:hypothetical protein n=1 Tax=Nocardioides sp. TaxID=35761 RepID=UPI003F1122A6
MQPTQCTQSGPDWVSSKLAGIPMIRCATSPEPQVGQVPRGTSYGSVSESSGGSSIGISLSAGSVARVSVCG